MADLARCGKSGALMRRVRGAGVILLMTRVTQRAVQRVVIVDVAVCADARWHRVHPCQLEAGAVVVKSTIRPLHRVVAGLAGRR